MASNDEPDRGLGAQIRRSRESRGWSQAELAKRAGTTQQTVNRIEAGQTAHSRAIAPIIAALDLQANDQAAPATGKGFDFDFNKVPRLPPALAGTEPQWTPVFETWFNGSLTDLQPVSYLNTPDPLLNVRDNYGLIVSTREMEPAFRRGDIILVNPHIPARADNDVVLIAKSGASGIICTLVNFDDEGWQVRRWNPAREESLSVTEWPTCHVIVGKYARV
jgi:transcriptional regulator with XRE-family HTH domain